MPLYAHYIHAARCLTATRTDFSDSFCGKTFGAMTSTQRLEIRKGKVRDVSFTCFFLHLNTVSIWKSYFKGWTQSRLPAWSLSLWSCHISIITYCYHLNSSCCSCTQTNDHITRNMNVGNIIFSSLQLKFGIITAKAQTVLAAKISDRSKKLSNFAFYLHMLVVLLSTIDILESKIQKAPLCFVFSCKNSLIWRLK